MSIADQTHSGPFYAFRFRNFRIFFVGQLVSVAGSWMQMVAQQWLVYDLTKSPVWLGIVSGSSAIPYVLFSLWGGKAADRHPRRVILLFTQTGAMLLAFVLAALSSNLWTSIRAWQIAVIAGIGGILNAYTMPAQQAFVSEMIDEPSALGNAIALNSLRFNLARFLGPLLAGLVLWKLGASWCFLLNGLSFLAVIASLALMQLPLFVPRERNLSMWEGFGFLWNQHSALRTVSLVATTSLFGWSASTLYPVFADNFHRGATGFSTMMSVNGIGAASGGLAVAFFGGRIPRRNLVYGGATLFTIALFLLSLAPTFYSALVCLLISGFSMIVFAINANTKVQEEVPDALRGRVMAIYSLLFQGLMPVGGLEIGFLAHGLNAALAVRINAILLLICTGGLFAWAKAEEGRMTRSSVE
jgi:MFS family permease